MRILNRKLHLHIPMAQSGMNARREAAVNAFTRPTGLHPPPLTDGDNAMPEYEAF